MVWLILTITIGFTVKFKVRILSQLFALVSVSIKTPVVVLLKKVSPSQMVWLMFEYERGLTNKLSVRMLSQPLIPVSVSI